MRNKGAICIHEHDSKRKIYVVLFDFWGFTLRPPLGLCHWILLGTSIPPDSSIWPLPQPLTPGEDANRQFAAVTDY